MDYSTGLIQIAFVFLAAVAVFGIVVVIFFPKINGQADLSKRVVNITTKGSKSNGKANRFKEGKHEKRRNQIQESLEKFEASQQTKKKKKINLRMKIKQAGLDLSTKGFWIMSAISAVVGFILAVFGGASPVIALGAGFAAGLGLPRWFLKFMTNRRLEKFLTLFADAIDVMVRGLRAGLPVNEAMKVIATEMDAPVGPEFTEVVQGQRVGITLEQGVERMLDRVPLPEVNFLSIVMSIQKTTGGNLAEALDNLSHVLRDRKKMKAKIQAISQEAKASASIIGGLPFVIGGGMMILNPEYLNPLFGTQIGNILLGGSAAWMTAGILIMRKMINFKI